MTYLEQLNALDEFISELEIEANETESEAYGAWIEARVELLKIVAGSVHFLWARQGCPGAVWVDGEGREVLRDG